MQSKRRRCPRRESILRNKTKEKARAGEPVLGTIAMLDDPAVGAVMGQADVDFFLIDTQHTPIGPDNLGRIITGLNTDREIIVRVLTKDPWLVNQALDVGADGVIIPYTNTAEEVANAISGAKYPPLGTRSWGSKAVVRYGGAEKYAEVANEEAMCLPQIETVEAVDNIDEILQVDGVDGIMVGPADLGITMGIPGPYNGHPEVDAMISHILDKCKEHGVPWGMFTSSFDFAEKWLREGGQIVTVGHEIALLGEGIDQMTDRMAKVIASLD